MIMKQPIIWSKVSSISMQYFLTSYQKGLNLLEYRFEILITTPLRNNRFKI